jgi:hypothetical protein
MAVQARVYVAEIALYAWGDGGKVVMRAVTRGGDDNKSWAAATPSAQFEMQVNNPDAFAWFSDRLGKDVAVTFSEVPASE